MPIDGFLDAYCQTPVARYIRGGTKLVGTEIAAARMRGAALREGVPLHLRIHPRARVSPGIRLQAWGEGPVTIEIGPRSRIEDGVLFRVHGGATIRIGPDCTIRRGAVLNVNGLLELAGRNQIGWYCTIHCAERVTFGPQTALSEQVMVVDSTHFRSDSKSRGYENSVSKPVVLGQHVWLAAKSTVTYGVTIGDNVTVASGSLVNRSMPADSLVAGSPAVVIKENWSR